MKENLEDYIGGKISATEKQILINRWCSIVWGSISTSSVSNNGAESDDGDGYNYVENKNGAKDNIDSKLSSVECSCNWSS